MFHGVGAVIWNLRRVGVPTATTGPLRRSLPVRTVCRWELPRDAWNSRHGYSNRGHYYGAPCLFLLPLSVPSGAFGVTQSVRFRWPSPLRLDTVRLHPLAQLLVSHGGKFFFRELLHIFSPVCSSHLRGIKSPRTVVRRGLCRLGLPPSANVAAMAENVQIIYSDATGNCNLLRCVSLLHEIAHCLSASIHTTSLYFRSLQLSAGFP